jgi:hypothetical protein
MDLVSFDNILIQINNGPLRTTYIRHTFQKRYREYWYVHISTDKSKKGHGSNKLRTYNKFKSNFQLEPYLNYPNILKYRSIIAKFRLSAHKLKIETGRYNSRNAYIPADQRICEHCNLERVEDEEHFLIECPKYNPERQIMFKVADHHCKNFSNLSSHNKFIWIMSKESLEIISTLGYVLLTSFKKHVGQ